MSTTLHLPVEDQLPSLAGATGWLNSEPLTATSLRGKPVLVEFWTFTCINWIRTLPYVRSWSEKYQPHGLVVLGVHTPEFEVERDVENVRRAAKDMRIGYPIAIDSDYAIWRAFGNQYWPALYFADSNGQIRHHRFGEGEYEYSELVIQLLLKAAGAHEVSHRFHARDLHLVMAPAPDNQPVGFRVLLDGEPPGPAHGVDTDEQGEGIVTAPRLYQLIRQPGAISDRTLEITFLGPGVHAYVFTFG